MKQMLRGSAPRVRARAYNPGLSRPAPAGRVVSHRPPPMPRLSPGRVWPVVSRVAAAAALAACAPADRAFAPAAPATPRFAAGPGGQATGVVISQFYGAGGNNGATLRNDYVELYNTGASAVTLTGWSLQYASATGTGNFGANLVALSGTIQPGGYFLVQLAGGTNGAALSVTPNQSSTAINLAGAAGKIALVNSTTGLACNGGSTACSEAQRAQFVDLVGYGNANFFEGTAAAPTLTATTAAFRKTLNAGLQDTDNNGADFSTGAPNPRAGATTPPAGVTVTVTANPAAFSVGGTSQLTATVTQNGSPVTPTALAWSVNPTGRVTFSNQSGNTVTATGATAGTATVTATATVGGTPYTGTVGVTVNAPATSLTVEGYSFRGSDPIPVGFQETYRVRPTGESAYLRSGITWTTADPAVATVDALGNVTARGNGTTTLTATEAGTGRTGSISIPVTTFAWSDTVGVYANALQFGTPAAGPSAGASDGVLVERVTFAASWSSALGQPLWVGYNLDAAHRINAADRCDCFTPDPLLPNGAKVVTSADYDGTNFSRGHMTMSADRTRGALDNATTFYFTNIIPQTNQNNAGPWLGLEIFLGDLARNENKEIYIFDGGARYSGFLQSANPLVGANRVAIPTRTWKVAVIMERGKGIADVRSASDVRVIAVDMPNTTTIPQVQAQWVNYQVSVDSVERLTGLDLLSALPDGIEAQVEGAVTATTRPAGLEVQPERISVSATAAVSAVLLSGVDFDATTFAPADLRLVTQNGTQVAPISRNGVVNTSTRDVNGDGKLDRVVNFATSALRGAGFSTAAPALTLRPAGTGTPAWRASDPTPPVVAP